MNKKSSILQAALVLLTKNGLHATPMSLIAKEAKTGMGTIYNYFEHKEQLVNAIYIQIKEEEHQLLQSVFSEDLPVRVQFEHYYRAVVDFFLKNPDYFNFMDQIHASPIITEESRAVGYQSIEPVLQLLAKGKTEYLIKDIGTEEILQFIGGSILSYIRWIIKAGKVEQNDLTIPNQIRLVWDGIKQ